MSDLQIQVFDIRITIIYNIIYNNNILFTNL